MSKRQMTPPESRKVLHLRIWVPGLIATSVFVLINGLLSGDQYSLQEGVLQFIVFYAIWVIIHYIFLRKQFKQLPK